MGGAVAAQVRDNRTVAPGCQKLHHLGVAVNVVGPAVKKNHGPTMRWTRLGVPDVEHPSVDLLQGRQRRGRLLGHLASSATAVDDPEESGGAAMIILLLWIIDDASARRSRGAWAAVNCLIEVVVG